MCVVDAFRSRPTREASIGAFISLDDISQRHFFTVIPKELGVIIVRMHLIEVAKETVEPLLQRVTGLIDFT